MTTHESKPTAQPGTCKSCGAAIVWCETTAGKAAPMERDDSGLWTIEGGIARKFDPSQPSLFGLRKRYSSHFAKCADADQWRKPRT